jgi:hypothetical protein
LEAVEEQASAAWVEGVLGDALEDFADGVLDGRTVLRIGEEEGGVGGVGHGEAAGGDGSAGGVVVVAKIFFAECR